LDFVRRVTTDDAPDLVPPGDRIAVFDNDGTLWPEQPNCIQFIFAFDRLKSLAHVNPDLRKAEPFRTVLEGGLDRLATLDEAGIIEIIKATQSGMSTEQFSGIVANWLDTTKDPRFRRVYTDLVYQPMLELLDYLGANEFKIFIVSGNGADFIRVFAKQTYRIPPERVVGSTTVAEYRVGKDGPVLMKMPEVEVLSDGPGKPEAIDRFIGHRPIFAFGNSDGDKEMLEWTAAGAGVHFLGLLHHTDAEREWAYDRDSKVGCLDTALELARAKDWTIVDMAADWNIVFPFQYETAGT
jgi:phosphoglycolate phosphatase-like HAD superfamily hydrolase